MGQKEDNVDKRSNRFRSISLALAVIAIAACESTPTYMPIGEDSIYGITKGDRVPVRWTAGGKIEMVRITSVNELGISGIGARGRRVTADYDELYAIGRRPRVDSSESITNTEAIVIGLGSTVGATMFATAVATICVEAPVVCLLGLASSGGEP